MNGWQSQKEHSNVNKTEWVSNLIWGGGELKTEIGENISRLLINVYKPLSNNASLQDVSEGF
jgi:hypothetical protein